MVKHLFYSFCRWIEPARFGWQKTDDSCCIVRTRAVTARYGAARRNLCHALFNVLIC